MALGPTTVYPSIPQFAEAYGVPKTYTITQPAAGAEFTRTVPGEGAWYIQAIRFTFVTSAVVATRVVQISITDGQLEYARVLSTAGQGASTTGQYTFAPYVSAATQGAAGFSALLPFPVLLLDPGSVLTTVTAAIDVGDQYSSIRMRVFELPWGPTGFPRGPAYQDVPDYVNGG